MLPDLASSMQRLSLRKYAIYLPLYYKVILLASCSMVTDISLDSICGFVISVLSKSDELINTNLFTMYKPVNSKVNASIVQIIINFFISFLAFSLFDNNSCWNGSFAHAV